MSTGLSVQGGRHSGPSQRGGHSKGRLLPVPRRTVDWRMVPGTLQPQRAGENSFKEVSFSEYDKGQANWKSKPATMICKVATSQCVREAFPKDYEGLYSEEEMIASGAIPASYTVVPETGEVITPDEEPDPPISQEQRQSLFRMAKEHLGGDANKILKEMVEQHGYESTNGMPVSVYNQVVSEIMRLAEEKRAEQASPEPVSEDGGSQEEPAE